MKTRKAQSAFAVAVVVVGIKEWRRESFYDTFTAAPRIVAIAETTEAAQAWIDQKEYEHARTPLLPGSRGHELYAIRSLSEPTTYVSKQNAAKDYISIPEHKYAVISNPAVIKL